MTFLRSIYLWSVGLGYIGPVLLIALVRTYLQIPEKIDPWLRRRLQALFKLLLSTPEVEFAEEIPSDRPLIFMANHSSLIDIPLLKAVIPAYFRGILAHDHLHYPIYGRLVKRMKNIPIYRDNVRKSLKSFETARACLDQGINITVLPEGNRSLDGRLLPFRKLPFHFAKKSEATIVPIAISGVYHMKNKQSFYLNPGRILVRFAPVIHTESVASLSAEDLMNLTQQRIFSNLESFEARGVNS